MLNFYASNEQVNNTGSLEEPFKSFKVGETLNARVVGKFGRPDNKKSQLWELSIKPNLISGIVA